MSPKWTPYGEAHPDWPSPPRDWDGGALLADDGKTYWIPPGWSWTRVHGYHTQPTEPTQ